MTDRTRYRVTATPWAHGWELDVDGVGVTQTFDEDDATAEQMARDCIAITLDVPVDSFDIHIDYPEDGPARACGNR